MSELTEALPEPTNLPEALATIQRLKDAIAKEKKRADAAETERNAAHLAIDMWKVAQKDLLKHQQEQQQAHLEALQEKTREYDELSARFLDRGDQKMKELEECVRQRDAEIGNMAMDVTRLHREKGHTERKVDQLRKQVSIMHTRLGAALDGVERSARKRDRDDSDDELETELSNATKDKGTAASHASKKPKLSSSTRIVPCTQCFTKGWECDNDDPVSGCKNCQLRGKASKCKRVMCKKYNGDTCKNTDCKFAHEKDRFPNIVKYTILKVKPVGKSPVEQRKLKQDGDKDASG